MVSRFTRFFIISCFALLLIGSLFFLNPPIRVYKDAITNEWFSHDGVEPYHPPKDTKEKDSHIGGVIMGKLGNETAKAQLGRATWKLLHTMTLRFPEDPTQDERDALKSYFYLSSRLYPCGECAAEFQLLLKENPPQTSSRKTASLWLCHVHNLVNKRLGKDIFDCNALGDTYDCGCGDDPVEQKKKVPPVDDLTGEPLIKGG